MKEMEDWQKEQLHAEMVCIKQLDVEAHLQITKLLEEGNKIRMGYNEERTFKQENKESHDKKMVTESEKANQEFIKEMAEINEKVKAIIQKNNQDREIINRLGAENCQTFEPITESPFGPYICYYRSNETHQICNDPHCIVCKNSLAHQCTKQQQELEKLKDYLDIVEREKHQLEHHVAKYKSISKESKQKDKRIQELESKLNLSSEKPHKPDWIKNYQSP